MTAFRDDDGGVPAGSPPARSAADPKAAAAALPIATADDEAAALVAEFDRAATRAGEKRLASHSDATNLAYGRIWAAFVDWCARMQKVDPERRACPASDATIAHWVGSFEGQAYPTVRKKVAAVRLAHRRLGVSLPERLPLTEDVIRGHRREQAGREPRVQGAATSERIVAMVDTLPTDTLAGARDRALLLVGWDTALRRSELVGIDLEHLERTSDGYTVWIPRSKGDPLGTGQSVALARQDGSVYCPAAALEHWLERSGRTTGPVFVSLHAGRHVRRPGEQRLSPEGVARIVKRAAAAAKLPGSFSGHSLRRGLITSALETGVRLDTVQGHARHADPRTTMGYLPRRRAIERHPRLVLGAPSPSASPAGQEAVKRLPPDDAVEERATFDGSSELRPTTPAPTSPSSPEDEL